jgi:Leucine-rich repeat (LRR) protein
MHLKLAKSMEEMTLQGTEIKRLQEEIENLQKLKSSFQQATTLRGTHQKNSSRNTTAAKANSHGQNTSRGQGKYLDGYLQIHK